jgi:glycosyltransferase involved in cell wall biosynthesis
MSPVPPTSPTSPTSPTGAGTISVIVAVKDGAAFVHEALESVVAQTRAPLEIVVVDDGSTDGTAAVVTDWAAGQAITVHLIRQENRGAAAARNRAIEHSTGDYLAVLDADDRWPADRLADMAGHLDTHPEVGIVLGHQRVAIDEGAPLPAWLLATGEPTTGEPTTDEPAAGEPAAVGTPARLPIGTNSFLARRTVFEQIGGYATDMRHGEDTDWVLRARDAGVELTVLDRVVLVRGIRGTNLTLDTEAQRRALFDVLQRRMVRRRDATGAPP